MEETSSPKGIKASWQRAPFLHITYAAASNIEKDSAPASRTLYIVTQFLGMSAPNTNKARLWKILVVLEPKSRKRRSSASSSRRSACDTCAAQGVHVNLDERVWEKPPVLLESALPASAGSLHAPAQRALLPQVCMAAWH
eukprot:965157-Amphidinium_carterae.1